MNYALTLKNLIQNTEIKQANCYNYMIDSCGRIDGNLYYYLNYIKQKNKHLLTLTFDNPVNNLVI